MYSSAYVWAKVLGHMESRLTPQVVSTWFDDTEILELTDEKLVLYSPSSFRKDIILRRCVGYIKEAMQEIFQLNVDVVVLDDTEIEAYRGKSQKPEFIEFNPQFTFDNFVVGSSNRFAHAAAVSVANNPAETYNPLFIYGPSGLGKTHLLYAIASVVHKNHPSYNIVYIKGDQFTNELIAALQEVYGDLFFTEQNDGGMHIVAFLAKGSADREIARCWQEQQLQVNALSAWYRGSGKRYGLVMGYNNVRSYQEALDLLERPKRQTLELLS